MTRKVPAYGARSAKGPVAPLTIERRDPEPGDVEIDILYCGICHSDLHKVNNDWENTHFPIVPGHEIVGRVVSTGATVRGFRKGDLVGVGCFVSSCRKCEACQAGHEMFCREGAIFTFDSFDAPRNAWTMGGYSTALVVDERYVLKIPRNLEPSRAAPLMCAGITTYSPLRQFGCKPGDEVAVVGLGGLGHMAVRLAAAMGAVVTVVSSSPKKEDDARRLGAAHFVVRQGKSSLGPLEGRFRLLVDTVSAPHDLTELTTLLRSFGTAVLVGLPPGTTPVDAAALVFGNRRVAGSNIGGIVETQEMLDFCGTHGVAADVEVIRAPSINDAYRRMERGDVRYRFVIDATSLGA